MRLVRDVEERDRYGRLLAYVYRARDGLFVNAALVRRGYAVPLTIPPNVTHADEFRAPGRLGPPQGAWAVVGLPIVIRSGRGNADATEPGRHRGGLRRGDRRRSRAPGADPGAGDPADAGRHRERTKKQGSLRFWLVLLTLIATAVIVTIAMFETLYYVMG